MIILEDEYNLNSIRSSELSFGSRNTFEIQLIGSRSKVIIETLFDDFKLYNHILNVYNSSFDIEIGKRKLIAGKFYTGDEWLI